MTGRKAVMPGRQPQGGDEMNRCFRWVVLGVLSMAVAACGGGGAGETPPPDDPVAIAPLASPKSLAIDYDASNFTLRWDAVPGADGYEVVQDPDGPAGPLAPVVVAKVAGTSVTVPVAFADRLAPAASYSVAACGGAACHAASSPVTPDLDATIGLLLRHHARAQESTGYKLALSGDGLTLIASAPFDARDRPGVLSDPDADTGPPEKGTWGAVVVFTRADARSPWRQQAVLRPSNAAPSLQFGESLAISADGHTVAVGLPWENGGTRGIIQGAPADTSTNVETSGATYVFVRNAGTWTEQAYIQSTTATRFQSFGTAVALSGDGDTLAVGTPGDGTVADMAGAVHLFSRAAGVWSAQQIVTASNGERFDFLGSALALSADGQTLAVAARSLRARLTTRWGARALCTFSPGLAAGLGRSRPTSRAAARRSTATSAPWCACRPRVTPWRSVRPPTTGPTPPRCPPAGVRTTGRFMCSYGRPGSGASRPI
jgi:hypothetical protein